MWLRSLVFIDFPNTENIGKGTGQVFQTGRTAWIHWKARKNSGPRIPANPYGSSVVHNKSGSRTFRERSANFQRRNPPQNAFPHGQYRLWAWRRGTSHSTDLVFMGSRQFMRRFCWNTRWTYAIRISGQSAQNHQPIHCKTKPSKAGVLDHIELLQGQACCSFNNGIKQRKIL